MKKSRFTEVWLEALQQSLDAPASLAKAGKDGADLIKRRVLRAVVAGHIVAMAAQHVDFLSTNARSALDTAGVDDGASLCCLP